MKPDDVKPDTSIDFDFEVNRESSKFSVGDHIRISKKKKVIKGWVNWAEEVLWLKTLNIEYDGYLWLKILLELSMN